MRCIVVIGFATVVMSLGACQSNTKKQTATAGQESSCKKDCNGCEKSSETKPVALSGEAAGVYYFHGDRRCATCVAVGSTAKEVAEKLGVAFFDVNLEREENKALAKQFQASGSGLFVKHKNSDKIEELTAFAFNNAVGDRQAYVEKLEATIQSGL